MLTIDIITRVQHMSLYDRMRKSAMQTYTHAVPGFLHEAGETEPRIAETYNRLGNQSTADILIFAHDDIVFVSDGWDSRVIEALGSGYDVAGIIGTTKYTGGLLFDSGVSYAKGKHVTMRKSGQHVKICSPGNGLEDVQAVDGMFMACSRAHFLKTGFDEKLTGLWYYDVDFCLRSRCCIVDTLIMHNKPDELENKYKGIVKPIEDYDEYFNTKHGLSRRVEVGDQITCLVDMDHFLGVGQEGCHEGFKRNYAEAK